MIQRPTAFILGAGASAPYEFYTGEALLNRAREYSLEELAEQVRPGPVNATPALYDALSNTLESSIDAMLETQNSVVAKAGKAVIARLLLEKEREARRKKHAAVRGWYRTLFAALSAETIAASLAQPVTFITYNYDRSLEYCLANAWRVKFSPDSAIDPPALRKMFIHLHGQLGLLPELGGDGSVVHYGGSEVGITSADVDGAIRAIQIVHEPQPDSPQFVAARNAIVAAERVVFLGFGFARRNVERLQLDRYLHVGQELYATAFGLSEKRARQDVDGPLVGSTRG